MFPPQFNMYSSQSSMGPAGSEFGATSDAARLAIEAARESKMLTKSPWVLTKWLTTRANVAPVTAATNSVQNKHVRDLASKNVKKLDHNEWIFKTNPHRAIVQDPAHIWKSIHETWVSYAEYSFRYLFHCIELAPDHIKVPANEKLIKAFYAGKLSEDLGAFNALVKMWLVNLPTEADHTTTHTKTFSGCRSMQSLYKRFIVDYIKQEGIRPEQYFDRMIKSIELTAMPLKTLQQRIELQYSMQKFMRGTISREDYDRYLTKLYDKFNAA